MRAFDSCTPRLAPRWRGRIESATSRPRSLKKPSMHSTRSRHRSIHVEVTDELVRTAGALARKHGLRGYDAVHLAAGLKVSDDDVVFVTGDMNLATAARVSGVAVSNTNTNTNA